MVGFYDQVSPSYLFKYKMFSAEPGPFPAVHRADRKIPESSQAKMIGRMIGRHGIQPAAIDKPPEIDLHPGIMTGTRPCKKRLENLGGKTIGNGEGHHAEQDKNPGLMSPCAKRIVYHESIKGRPGKRFTQIKHKSIQYGMIRVMLNQHEKDPVDMVQPL